MRVRQQTNAVKEPDSTESHTLTIVCKSKLILSIAWVWALCHAVLTEELLLFTDQKLQKQSQQTPTTLEQMSLNSVLLATGQKDVTQEDELHCSLLYTCTALFRWATSNSSTLLLLTAVQAHRVCITKCALYKSIYLDSDKLCI